MTLRMKGVKETVDQIEKEIIEGFDDWGQDEPELHSELVGYGTAAGLLLGISAIGAPAILALAGYGGYKLAVGAKEASYERFLVRRLKEDPGFVEELRAQAEEAQSK